MYNVIRICILIITLPFSAVAFAAEFDSSSWIHFSTAEGLPSKHVYCGMTDKLGNVWLGTDNGVVKYDGYNFRVFTTEDGLPNNDVWRLWQDSLDRIWVYSISSSFGYIKNDRYRSVNFSLGDDVFRVIDEGVTGNSTCFIVNGRGSGFIAINNKDSITFKSFTTTESYSGITDDMHVYKRSAKDRFKLMEFKYNGQKLVLIRSYSDSTMLSTAYVSSCNAFKRKLVSYLYSDIPARLMVYDVDKHILEVNNIVFYGGDKDEYIYVKTFYPYNLSLITNKAIYQFHDNDFRKPIRIPYRNIIPSKAQLTFYMEDRSGNDWYMTNDDGVWIKVKQGHVFTATSKLIDLKGAVCVGDNGRGRSYWYNKTDKKILIAGRDGQVTQSIFTDKNILKIKPYNDSILIVSSYMSFDIYNLYDKTWRSFFKLFKYNIDVNNRERKNIDSLFKFIINNKDGWEWQNNQCFIAYGSVGVNKIELLNDSILHTAISEGKYYGMVNDSINKKYWFYNQSSLGVYDLVSQEYTSFGKNILKVLGIPSISKILMDRYGNVYILSEKNIIQYNTGTNKFSHKKINVDLKGAILAINKDKLCVAGSFGFAFCDIYGVDSTGTFKVCPNVKTINYGIATSLYVNDSIAILSTDNETYRIDLIDIEHNKSYVNGRKLPFVYVGVKQPKMFLLKRNDTLKFEQGIPSLNINMVNMFGKGSTKLRYKISGYSEWSEVKSGDVIIAGLDVDKYYKVSCEISDDLWSSGTYDLYVYREPKWWQTRSWKITFWVSGVLVLILVLLFVIYVTKNIVARKNAKRQQLTDLELRAIYSQINPHFIFNTLSTALFFIDKKDFEQSYSHISKFSRLLRSYLKSSQERYVSVSEEIKMLENYIELQQVRFEDKFDYRIEIDNKIAADSILIPSLLLQPLVENAINHGLFHKQGRGLLIIRFKQPNQNELICEIEDSGIGRAKAEEIKNESSTKKESYGTRLTQSLIAIFKEYEKMNINLEYIDKYGEDTGTIVKLSIKNLKYVTGV